MSVCPLGASSLWGFHTHHIVKYDIKLSLSLVRAFERVSALKQANSKKLAQPDLVKGTRLEANDPGHNFTTSAVTLERGLLLDFSFDKL